MCFPIIQRGLSPMECIRFNKGCYTTQEWPLVSGRRKWNKTRISCILCIAGQSYSPLHVEGHWHEMSMVLERQQGHRLYVRSLSKQAGVGCVAAGFRFLYCSRIDRCANQTGKLIFPFNKYQSHSTLREKIELLAHPLVLGSQTLTRRCHWI